MKNLFLLAFITIYPLVQYGQGLPNQRENLSPTKPIDIGKPPLDTSVFDKWPSVEKAAISNDGNYILYVISKQPVGANTLVLKTINGSWENEIIGAGAAKFTDDSRKAVFSKPKDSFCIIELGSGATECMSHVRDCRLFGQGASEKLACQLNSQAKELLILDLPSRKRRSYTDVSEYLISTDGNSLVLKMESKSDTVVSQSLRWLDLSEGNSKVIWEGIRADNLVLDADGRQLAFTVDDNISDSSTMKKEKGKSIWCYKKGTNKATLVADIKSTSIENELVLDGLSTFNMNGSKLFISLKEKALKEPTPNAVKVDIWSYTDAKLQSEQLKNLDRQSYSAIISIDGKLPIIQLQQQNERIIGSFVDFETCDILLIMKGNGGIFNKERNWNRTAQNTYYLVSSIDGVRKKLPKLGAYYEFSPSGKYLIGQDAERKDVYSYEIATGITRNITKFLPIPIGDGGYDRPAIIKNRGLHLSTWLANDTAALIEDRYDIWKIDPTGKKVPINLTKGYGRKNNIVFRLLDMPFGKTMLNNKLLVVSAFNQINKYSGFYGIDMSKISNPEILSMGPYNYNPAFIEKFPVKARDVAIYLVKRQSATQSPNYFLTEDFKSFVNLSSVYPEKKYNWMSSELVTFTSLDGKTEQAVLYKPESFDQMKKYPVIIHYYERLSQNLNKYQRPGGDTGGGDLDISWFVSHGYIVFTPDIHYRIGETGQSACNSIVAAEKYLSGLHWVDAKHIGIQGHSFGGYETNYVVSHSKIFTAACSASGISNIISDYGSLRGGENGGGENDQWYYELEQGRIGSTLWEHPDLYIKNSPIFNADKVSTPILIIANKKDANVFFMQGVEWFTALRRLGKKAWHGWESVCRLHC